MKPRPMTTRVCLPVYLPSYHFNNLLVATLNPATMETLQLFRGDTIIVRSVESPLVFHLMPYVSL